MKFTFHLNSKNTSSVVTGACVIVLAYIPLAVPTDHWWWLRWEITAISSAASAIACLVYQAITQSKEDAERNEREQKRDEILNGLQKSFGQASQALLAGNAAETLSPGVDIDNFFQSGSQVASR